MQKEFLGHQLMTFCTRNNIEITEAPVNDQIAIGLLESLMQTIRNRLHPSKMKNWYKFVLQKACIKDYRSPTANM